MSMPRILSNLEPPLPAGDATARIASLVANYSLEVSSRSARDLDACLTHLERGSDVFINFIAGDELGAKVRCAAALAASGFRPVPHIGARHLVSARQLDDLLARLAGEAGVDRALLIGGDAARPAGPFESSAAVLASGLLRKHGFRAAGFAGYPEAHPRIAAAPLATALAEKLRLAAEQGIEPFLVTQFCFDPEPILAWLAALRARGLTTPVRIGLAGPANVATLLRFAVRCGVGNSIRALTSRADRLLRLVTDNAPDSLVRSIAEAKEMAARVAGLHFFPFGGVAKTARWANAVKHGRFRLVPGGLDVRV
jgi:methylenetetrahydrofolate reductase (NADPH)